jgi:hypothetical protein
MLGPEGPLRKGCGGPNIVKNGTPRKARGRHARTTRYHRPAFRVDHLTPEAVSSLVIVADYSVTGLTSLAYGLSPQQAATDLATQRLQQPTDVVRQSQQPTSRIHAEETETMSQEDLRFEFSDRTQRDV